MEPIIVVELDAVFFFQQHDELDCIERISAEHFLEGSIEGRLVLIHPVQLGEEPPEAFFDR